MRRNKSITDPYNGQISDSKAQGDSTQYIYQATAQKQIVSNSSRTSNEFGRGNSSDLPIGSVKSEKFDLIANLKIQAQSIAKSTKEDNREEIIPLKEKYGDSLPEIFAGKKIQTDSSVLIDHDVEAEITYQKKEKIFENVIPNDNVFQKSNFKNQEKLRYKPQEEISIKEDKTDEDLEETSFRLYIESKKKQTEEKEKSDSTFLSGSTDMLKKQENEQISYKKQYRPKTAIQKKVKQNLSAIQEDVSDQYLQQEEVEPQESEFEMTQQKSKPTKKSRTTIKPLQSPQGHRDQRHGLYYSRDHSIYEDDESVDEEIKQVNNDQYDNKKAVQQKARLMYKMGNALSHKFQSHGNQEKEFKQNESFRNYHNIFKDLTKHEIVQTEHLIVSIVITNDSSRAITVTKANDKLYFVSQFNLQNKNYEQTFQEKVGGDENCYIKLKEVEQNKQGNKFCISYFNDGMFYIRTFTKEKRSYEEALNNEIDLNKELNLDNHTMAHQGFSDPYITCTFINDDLIFANLFYNKQRIHYHFLIGVEEKKVFNIVQRQLNCSPQNFPYKCFYYEDECTVYSFYRQGQAFSVPINPAWSKLPIMCEEIQEMKRNSSSNDSLKAVLRALVGDDKAAQLMPGEDYSYKFEKITDKDLGQMFLINGKSLVARCSSQILFFKKFYDQENGTKFWQLYEQLEHRGFIFYMKGSQAMQRIQITTDEKIYFYQIDPDTLLPKLENVMFNFMNCNQMMIGSKEKYGITYKTNQQNFEIFTRKYIHNFRVNVVEDQLEGSKGAAINSLNAFIVSKVDVLMMYNADTLEEIKENRIQIKLLKTDKREPNEIIGLSVSYCQRYLAVISGKNLIMNQQKPNQLWIYRLEKRLDGSQYFMFIKNVLLIEIEEFSHVSMQFHFRLTNQFDNDDNLDTLVFAKKDKIFELNFETLNIKNIIFFKEELKQQPSFFLMNDDQTAMVIASQQDCIYYDKIQASLLDLDQLYNISSIQQIIYDIESQSFYLLANKFEQKLGFFIIFFNENDPNEFNFIMKLKNKLDIANANISVMRNENTKTKELVVSYKTIYINTYNIIVFDISNQVQSKQVNQSIFRHESFQLWETSIVGILLSKNKDFITITREGISVTALGSIPKRCFNSSSNNQMMVHSLESMNFLKIDPGNCTLFEFAAENKVLSIQQQYIKKKNQIKQSSTQDQTKFDTIYKIRISEITLRELMLLQSIQYSHTMSDILQLVQEQPNSSVFYKSFLELDGSNMVSILSFDSRSMKILLDETKNSQYFQEKFPIFYKNKVAKTNNSYKYFYRSAIDNALTNNQIVAVEYMIEYIIKYQNNYISSFLFTKNFIKLIKRGINVGPLLGASIFRFYVDYDEWPSTHWNSELRIDSYNSSIFELRHNYSEVYPDHHLQTASTDHAHCDDHEEKSTNWQIKQEDTKKLYKVLYTVNVLPMSGMYAIKRSDTGGYDLVNQSNELMDIIAETEELEIFDSEAIQELIEYKWSHFGQKNHLIGCFMHFLYMLTITLFVKGVYVDVNDAHKTETLLLMNLGIIYPFLYDTIQLCRVGPKKYFSEFWNYSDFIFIWSGIVNIFTQYIIEDSHGIQNRITMLVVILMATVKTFFFLRVFSTLSYIVTMLTNVIYDMRIFLIFYLMVVFQFGLVFCVLGVGNFNVEGDFKEFVDGLDEDYMLNVPNEEYDLIGMFWGNFLYVLRLSIGDFDFEASTYLTSTENQIFWILWTTVVILLCIIFLNFIISEIGASYTKYSERLHGLIMKERAGLITEAETMIRKSQKNTENFPKYIIRRQIDT